MEVLPSPNTAVSLDPYRNQADVATTLGGKAVTPKTGYAQPVVEEQLQQLPEQATFTEGLGAGFRSTLAAAVWDAFEAPLFNSQNGYDPTPRYRADIQKLGRQLNPEDQKYVLAAHSDEDYTYRLQQIQNKHNDEQIRAEAPVGAFLGSIPDVDILLGGPIGKTASSAVKGGRVAKYASAAAAGGVTMGGLSYGVSTVVPRSEQEILMDSLAGALGGMFDGVKGIDKFDRNVKTLKPDANPVEIDKLSPNWSQYLSAHDKLSQFADKDLANKLLANPMEDIGESAVTYTRDAKLAGDRLLGMYEQTMDKIVGNKFTLNPRTRAARREERLGLEKETMQWLNTARRNEELGIEIAPHSDPRVRALADAYTSSGYAEEMLRRLKDAGVQGADDIAPSKYYVPVKHNYEKMEVAVAEGRATWNGIYKMYGAQLGRMFPNLVDDVGLSLDQLGKHFVNTQKARVSDAGGQTFRGMTRDEIANTLIAAGVDRQKVRTMLDSMYAKNADASKAANLRRRLDWNFDTQHIDAKGNVTTINDFMDTDMTSVLNSYNRAMSGRIGLGRMGYASEAALDEALGAALDARPKGLPRAEALKFFDEVKNSLLGRPTGDQIPDLLRSANTLASTLQLANSGLYNLVDYANIAKEFGLKTVATEFLPNLKGIGLEKMTVKEAESLKDVLTGRLYAEGRMRSVVTHMEDNFEATIAGNVHEAIHYGGQSTRFLNGSEFIRRHQIQMVAGALDDLTVKFTEGDAKAAKYFESLNIDKEFGDAIKAQVKAHGTILERWPSDIRDRFTTVMTSATDNVALMVRNGEQPAFTQYTLIGKAIFPYMSFVWGATNKLLRRGYQRDGALGIAQMLIYQAPLSVMVAGASNVINGKDFNKDLMQKTVRTLPMLGAVSMPLDAIMGGEYKGSVTAFGAANSILKLGSEAAKGNLNAATIVKNTPGVAVFTPARYIANLWDQQGK